MSEVDGDEVVEVCVVSGDCAEMAPHAVKARRAEMQCIMIIDGLIVRVRTKG